MEKPGVARNSLQELVGERGFEPPTPWSRTRCSTRLSHSPTCTADSARRCRADIREAPKHDYNRANAVRTVRSTATRITSTSSVPVVLSFKTPLTDAIRSRAFVTPSLTSDEHLISSHVAVTIQPQNRAGNPPPGAQLPSTNLNARQSPQSMDAHHHGT